MNIALDIETNGTEINTQINYIGCYYKTNGVENFISFKIPEDIEAFKIYINDSLSKGNKYILHNGKFDSARILYSYGVDIPIAHDTMVLTYLVSTVDELHMHKNKWLGLKPSAKRFLGVDDWDVALSQKTSKKAEEVLPYLKLDCKYTYELFYKLIKILPKSKIITYKLIIKALNAYKYIEQNGLPINLDKVKLTYEKFKKDEQEIQEQLMKYKDINYNSSKQLQEFLFQELQLPIISYTKKGQPSTGIEVLKELQGTHPIIDIILKYRAITKGLAFLESWKKNAIQHKDGQWYVHSNFNMCGTVTGRTSSSDVNLQQIPRNKELKALFNADKQEGWELVCLDYSQLELRFAGLVADVTAIKDSYRKGEDLHYKMAATITGKPISEITKAERTQAKAANFGFLYGMSYKSFVKYAKISYGVHVTEEEAYAIRESFFRLYPELLEYYKVVESNLLYDFKEVSIMQREYVVNPAVLINKRTRQDWIRPAINFPVQSAGSDYVISGLIEVVNDPLLKDKVKIGATVHDSIIGLVKKDEHFYEYIRRIQDIMEHPKIAKSIITKDIDFPIIVDEEIGALGKGISIEEYKKLEEDMNGKGYKQV